MITLPPTPNGLLFRADILAHDYDDAAIARARRDGQLTRLIDGVYVRTASRYPDEVHRLKAIATWLSDRRCGATYDGAVSFHSAATLLQLDLLNPTFDRVHLTIPGCAGNIRPQRHTHDMALPSSDVTLVDGIPTTTIERTAVDVACASRFPAALTVVDSALRNGTDREVMRSILGRGKRRGVGVARRAVEFGDAQSESTGESWSRSQMITAGLPLPTLQRWYDVRHHRWRVDFDWAGRLVGEFDGLKKYTKLLRHNEDAAAFPASYDPKPALARRNCARERRNSEAVQVIPAA